MQRVTSTPETECAELEWSTALMAPPPRAAQSLSARLRDAALWAVAGAVAARALNLIAWLLCARLLGKEAFGHLSVVQSTTGALGVLSGLGLGVTATKYTAELREQDPARAGRILGLGQAMAVAAGTALASGLMLGAPMLASRTLGAPVLTEPLRIGCGLVLFGAVNGFQTGSLVGLEAFRALARLGFWTGVLSLPCIAGGSWLWGVNGAVSGFVIALGVTAVAGHAALARECRLNGIQITTAGCRAELPILFHFSLPALLASALVSPAMWLCDTWLIHQRDGFAQLGLYGAADRWRLAILFIPAAMSAPVLSLLAHLKGQADVEGFRKVFRMNFAVTMGAVTILAVAAALLSRRLMHLFGSGYREGAALLSILALSAVPEAANTFLGQRVVTRSMWTRFWFDLILVCVLLLAGFFFIPRWRSTGLAAAYTLAFVVTSACLVVFDWKHEAKP